MFKILQNGKSLRTAVRTAVASLSIAGLPAAVMAADSTWTGATSHDWNDPTNWSNGFPTANPGDPTPGDGTVNTATGNYPIISADQTGGPPRDLRVGSGAGNTGRLDHTAGTAATGNSSWFFVGVSNGTGTYNLANTAVTGTGITGFGKGSGSLNVGRFWVAGADFNDNGNGTVNINTSGTLTAAFGDGSIIVGETFSGTSTPGIANGVVNFENGTVNSQQQTWIGRSGNGTWNQSGGTFNASGYMALGRETAGEFGDPNIPGSGTGAGNGTINLSGGIINACTAYGFTSIAGGTDATAALNISGTGIYDASFTTPEATANGGVVVAEGWQGPNTSQAKGSLTVSGNGELRLGANRLQIALTANANGIVNLDGGTISTAGVFKGAGSATFNFNGGTLRPTAASTDFIAGVGNVFVKNGGARIDTNGFDTTINAAFIGVEGSTGGITKAGSGTLTLTGVSSYSGATVVQRGTLKVNYSAILASSSTPLLTGAGGADVQNGSLVFDYTGSTSPAATIRTLLRSSFQAATTPGIIDSGQIRSTTATAKKGLGYLDNGSGNVTVKVALFGDADLDGGVSINDFNALATNFGKATGQVWVNGDFDYDGGVSINDFNLLAGNFGQTLPASSDEWAGLLAFAAAHNDLEAFQAVTGVPEPTTLGLLAGGVTLALRRRRQST